jgi:hypothetical protein
MPRTFIILLACLLLFGCSSPEKRAQALFDQGKYEEVTAKYPNLPIAKMAKDKVAEKRLREGKYEEIVTDSGFDTRAEAEATNRIAEKLYEGKQYDEVANKYPNTPVGIKVRNKMADSAWARISALKSEQQIPAIEEFLKDRRYMGTDAAQRAATQLR